MADITGKTPGTAGEEETTGTVGATGKEEEVKGTDKTLTGDELIMSKLTPAQKEMFAYLEEVNGQDFYNATDAALGKLDKAKFLKLPTDFVIPDLAVADVGDFSKVRSLTALEQARIYAMNKAAFSDKSNAVKGAILRVYMVAAGWVDTSSSYEITRETPPADSLTTFITDWDAIRLAIPRAKKLAYLLPIISEHVFRTMGHHYLTGQGVDFERKYKRAFDACVEPDLHSYLPAAELYHTVGHWVSLKRALDVATNPVQAGRLPNAMVIRSRAAPAGTAIITTTVAVLSALAGTGLKDAYLKTAGIDELVLTAMTERVTANPGQFHTIPGAYGFSALSSENRKELDKVKALASSMAPILQGFVDSLPRDCDLAMAKSLNKHANLNPTLRKQAKTFFATIARSRVGDIRELLNAGFRGTTITGEADALAIAEED